MFFGHHWDQRATLNYLYSYSPSRSFTHSLLIRYPFLFFRDFLREGTTLRYLSFFVSFFSQCLPSNKLSIVVPGAPEVHGTKFWLLNSRNPLQTPFRTIHFLWIITCNNYWTKTSATMYFCPSLHHFRRFLWIAPLFSILRASRDKYSTAGRVRAWGWEFYPTPNVVGDGSSFTWLKFSSTRCSYCSPLSHSVVIFMPRTSLHRCCCCCCLYINNSCCSFTEFNSKFSSIFQKNWQESLSII